MRPSLHLLMLLPACFSHYFLKLLQPKKVRRGFFPYFLSFARTFRRSFALKPYRKTTSCPKNGELPPVALLGSLLLEPSYCPPSTVAQANTYSPTSAFTPAQASYAAQIITISPAAAHSPAQAQY